MIVTIKEEYIIDLRHGEIMLIQGCYGMQQW